jgi:hypothetical protein
MFDWCAVTQPDVEYQSAQREMQFDNKIWGERSVLLALLTEVG